MRTARSKTTSRSNDWALFSIQTEWRGNAIRIRVCRNVENVCNSSKRPVLMQNMYPLSNQEKRPRVAEESPEKSNAVLHPKPTPTHRERDCQIRSVKKIMYQIPSANHADCNQEGQTSESLRSGPSSVSQAAALKQPHPSGTPKPGLHHTLHPIIRAAVSALTTAGATASGRTVAISSTDLAACQHAPRRRHHAPKSPCPWQVTCSATAVELCHG